MNLRQEVGGVKLKWRKLNSTTDIKTIPFKDFSQVIVFIESNEDAEMFLTKFGKGYWEGNYVWFYSNGEYCGWDIDIDGYPLDNEEDWNTIGTYYIPKRKVAKII